MGLTYAITTINWIFENFSSRFLVKPIFCFSSVIFKLLIFHNNIVKISENFAAIFTMGKMKIFDFFFYKSMTRLNIFVHR